MTKKNDFMKSVNEIVKSFVDYPQDFYEKMFNGGLTHLQAVQKILRHALKYTSKQCRREKRLSK